jgi:hypothetical protein
VPAADRTTDFSVLQNELKGKSTSIVFVAFDLLYLNGRDLRKLPLVHRKAELKKIIVGTAIQFSESFEIDGQAKFAHACKLGLEGVVSKVRVARPLPSACRSLVAKFGASFDPLARHKPEPSGPGSGTSLVFCPTIAIGAPRCDFTVPALASLLLVLTKR